jgi:hypothetical protein
VIPREPMGTDAGNRRCRPLEGWWYLGGGEPDVVLSPVFGDALFVDAAVGGDAVLEFLCAGAFAARHHQAAALGWFGGDFADGDFAGGSGQYREEQTCPRVWWSRSGRWEPSRPRCHRVAACRPIPRCRSRTFSEDDDTETSKNCLSPGEPPSSCLGGGRRSSVGGMAGVGKLVGHGSVGSLHHTPGSKRRRVPAKRR